MAVFIRYTVITDQDSAHISMLAMSLMLTVTAFLILIAFSYHIKFVQMVRRKNVSLFRICLVGLLSVSEPAFYHLFAVPDFLLRSLVLVLFILLFFRGRALLRNLTELFPLRDADIRNMFPQYPPKQRSDLFRLDGFILFMLIMPFAAKAIH